MVERLQQNQREFRSWCGLVVTLVPLASLVSSDVIAGDLLTEGDYLSANAVPVSRGPWLALHKTGDHWMLSPAQIRIHAESSDESEGMTYFRSNIPDATILIGGVSLKAGPVTAASSVQNDVGMASLTFKNEVYRFTTKDYRTLTMSNGNTSSVIPEWHPEMSVGWAGDLDRDGKLDVVMSCEDLACGFPPAVYLSSDAKPEEQMGGALVMGDGGVKVLMTGESYNLTEKAVLRASWLAVFEQSTGWGVVPAGVQILAKREGVKEVVSSVAKTKLLVSGGDIKSGPIDGASRILNLISTVVFRGKSYSLSQTKARGVARIYVNTDSDAWLLSGLGGESISVVWAGDMDGDGELDLLMRSAGQGWWANALYLSRDMNKDSSIKAAAARSFDD